MSDHEALATALAQADGMIIGEAPAWVEDLVWPLAEAARKRLAVTPEPCGTCGEKGEVRSAGLADETRFPGWYPCSDCHRKGYLYPAETVEAVAQVLMRYGLGDFLAVEILDAIRALND